MVVFGSGGGDQRGRRYEEGSRALVVCLGQMDEKRIKQRQLARSDGCYLVFRVQVIGICQETWFLSARGFPARPVIDMCLV